ncbi:hypothetical protein FRAHR75_460056 [Frankia sp. Hr75.2]|nr:hypothetical protein FRAHR75_460056 [Frankia sp. Hr75.2]
MAAVMHKIKTRPARGARPRRHRRSYRGTPTRSSHRARSSPSELWAIGTVTRGLTPSSTPVAA